jgi:D-tyrosyl-tRNA(Tyr) deacylase
VKGEILLVSQFTLYGDARGQNRPSFIRAAPPEQAKALYEHFVSLMKSKWPPTQTGQFAAPMSISLINDGPVTLLLE